MENLFVLAAAFVAVGIAVFVKQARAKRCSVHNAIAGKLAILAAVLAILLGILIFVHAYSQRLSVDAGNNACISFHCCRGTGHCGRHPDIVAWSESATADEADPVWLRVA